MMPQTFNYSPYLWQPASSVAAATVVAAAAQSAATITSSSMDAATLPIHDIPLSDFSIQHGGQPQHNFQNSSTAPSTTTNPSAAWILHAPDYCTAPQLVNDWPLVNSNAYYPLPSANTNSLYQQAVTVNNNLFWVSGRAQSRRH